MSSVLPDLTAFTSRMSAVMRAQGHNKVSNSAGGRARKGRKARTRAEARIKANTSAIASWRAPAAAPRRPQQQVRGEQQWSRGSIAVT